jgi:hypothetical protein
LLLVYHRAAVHESVYFTVRLGSNSMAERSFKLFRMKFSNWLVFTQRNTQKYEHGQMM